MIRSLSFVACIFVASMPLAAQTGGQDDISRRMAELEAQNRAILERLNQSEARNSELEGEVRNLRTSQSDLESEKREADLEEGINAMTRFDGVTFKDLTRSGNPIKFYGFIRLDAYYTSARMNNIIFPFFVQPEDDVNAKDSNDDEFAMDVRLTRFAFDINAGKIGSADVTGKLETDFASSLSGIVESRAMTRIRLAYINMKWGEATVRLGQDWDTIAPIFPAINGETLMWNAGNLGDRRPQASFIWNTGDPKGTEFELRLTAGLSGAVEALDLDAGTGVTRPFTSTIVDGFDSGHPHGQGRMAVTFSSWVEEKRATIGLWGYIAGLESDTKFDGERHFTAYALGLDWQLPIFGPLALRGEAFFGQALGDVRGGILQTINTAEGKEIDTIGGFAELVVQATPEFSITGGATIDNVDDDDISNGARELNWSMYVATAYNFGGGLKSGLDFIFWETQWDGIGIGNTLRINFYTMLSF